MQPKTILSLLFGLVLLGTVRAQDDGPKIVVQAPTTVPAGQIVWLKTDGTVADDLAWSSGAPDHAWSLAADKRSAMFQSMTTNKYLFVIAACRNNKIAVKCVVVEVTGGCTPSPNPPPPGPEPAPSPGPSPSPTPVTTLSLRIRELAERLVPATARSKANESSRAIRSTCSKIAALPSAYSPRTCREAIRQANASVLQPDVTPWEAFSRAASGEIVAALPSEPTVTDIVEVYIQVADGLATIP